ncbi:hypothetical protein [Haloarchaeobius sp. HME9146]|uniref:hypothetical protein n=1 Tax=Haloarchaeobius sp. HME9146 TaxID=2978732 RepID=UPI0021C024A3|nr:hypothetical protein [Haloarchaeobius sp. HME9146]MCT9098498.1 hypothetical protein [Haloarchaeobius sp. HME9146]
MAADASDTPTDETTEDVRVLARRADGLLVRDLADGPDWDATRNAEDPLAALDSQLGGTFLLRATDYPVRFQRQVDRLRPGYRVGARLTREPDSWALDSTTELTVHEAVTVDYATKARWAFAPAEGLWQDAVEAAGGDRRVASGAEVLTDDGDQPIAHCHVFADPAGVPRPSMLAEMRDGRSAHLELFASDPGEDLSGDVIDVIVVSPAERPYVAVLSVATGGEWLSHDVREEVGLPVVHAGTTGSRTAAQPVRWHDEYLRHERVDGQDRLYEREGQNPTADATGDTGYIDVSRGTVESTSTLRVAEAGPDLVFTSTAAGDTVEVARVQLPID